MKTRTIYRTMCAIMVMLSMAGVLHAANVKMELTYPAGRSPKVFTKGWMFGASCKIDGKDISNQVEWSGTGSFSPAKGPISRPTFKSAGNNTIVLKVKVGGKEILKKFAVTAVSPDKYAALGDAVVCPADSHGCPSCPHIVTGHIETGSPQVLVRGKPAARLGDGGHHAVCCGPNTFKITSGDLSVLINGKPAARNGDTTLHCGGKGRIGNRTGTQADGKYTGATTPALCKGPLVLTINGASVTGSYSGEFVNDKAFTIKTKWTGVFNAGTGRISGNVKGSSGSSSKQSPIGGKFEGSVRDDGISGVWDAVCDGNTASANFNLRKVGK